MNYLFSPKSAQNRVRVKSQHCGRYIKFAAEARLVQSELIA
jgi:hypothetical protein